MNELPPGTRIENYEILSVIGRGGMGIVYKARDLELDRLAAVKMMDSDIASTGPFRNRFRAEAKALARLQHPNIVGIHAFHDTPQGFCIMMEYVRGRTLAEILQQEKQLGIAKVLSIAEEIINALDHAHAEGVVHRDIKPSNIMLKEGSTVKVMDFGLAKLRDATRVTQAGSTAGSPGYMSPEQICGEESDHRTDIWALGVVLYEMLCGSLPFPGTHLAAIAYAITNHDPKSITELRPEVPPGLDACVQRCLQKDKTRRYQSMRELRDDLRRVNPHTSATLAETVASTASTQIRRSRFPSWTVAAAFVIVALGIALVLWPAESPEEPESGAAGPLSGADTGDLPGDAAQETGPVIRRSPSTVEEQAISVPHRTDTSRTSEELANTLVAAIVLKDSGTPKRVAVRPFTYKDTNLPGPFSRYLKALLENRLREAGGWTIIGESPGTRRMNASAGSPGVTHVLQGTIWESPEGYLVISQLRSAADDVLLASAEVRALRRAVDETRLSIKPPNAAQVVRDQKTLGSVKSAVGGLTVELWTNRGKENVVYTEGDTMRFFYRVSGPCYFRFMYSLANGRKALLTGKDDLRLGQESAGVERMMEELICGPPFGAEILQAFVQADPFPPARTVTEGDVTYLVEDFEEFVVATRGFSRVGRSSPRAEARVLLTSMEK